MMDTLRRWWHIFRRWWHRRILRRGDTVRTQKQRELEDANLRLRRLERYIYVKKAGQ